LPIIVPVVRMGHRDGERIGRVMGARIGLGQEHADHHADLCLLAVAGPDDGLLHQVGGVFGNRQAGDRRHQHGDAARLAELEGGGCVLVDEGGLDGGFVRRVLFHYPPQPVVNGEEPDRKRGPVLRR
jgi:hypothetical protein